MSEVLSKEKQKNMILHENMWKVMWRVSWPAIIAMVLYGLNSVFDAIFVGSFAGETALAGVTLAYPLSQMTLGIGSLIGVGAGSALSIALGAGDKRTQDRILGNVNYLSLIVSIVFGVLAYIFAEPLVRFMGGKGEALALGTEYFRVTLIGSLFWVHGLACNMVVRAEGKMKSAAVMMGVGLAINLVANYILVGLLHLSVVGAAWGTNLGMLVYTILGLVYFKRGKASFDGHPFKIYRDKKIIKAIMSMGMSSLIMSVMSLVQAIVVFNALSGVGTTSDIAFYGATYRIFTLMLTPLFGLMRALQPVAGINYGAQQHERVIKSAKVFILCGTILMLPFWLIMMVYPQGSTLFYAAGYCIRRGEPCKLPHIYGAASASADCIHVDDILSGNQQRQGGQYYEHFETACAVCPCNADFAENAGRQMGLFRIDNDRYIDISCGAFDVQTDV